MDYNGAMEDMLNCYGAKKKFAAQFVDLHKMTKSKMCSDDRL